MSEAQIFIGGLDSQTSTEELEALLYELLFQCGEVEDLRIPKNETGISSKGFAFAEMASADEATYAVLSLNGLRLNGRQLRVANAMQDADARKLNLKNLPYDINELDLYFALSERISVIRGVCLHRNKRDGRSEGKASVWMDSPQALDSAIATLDGDNPLYFNSIPVQVEF